MAQKLNTSIIYLNALTYKVRSKHRYPANWCSRAATQIPVSNTSIAGLGQHHCLPTAEEGVW